MNRSDELLRKAVIALDGGDYRQVKVLTRKLLKKRPGWQDALKLLGVAELRLNRYQHAAMIFEKLVLASQDDSAAHYNLGLARYKAGYPVDALAALQHAVSLNPRFTQGYTDLALCLRDCGHLDEAIDAAEQACDLEPFNARYQNNAGVVYEDYGLFDQALEKYQAAAGLAPSHPVYLKNYGLALLGYGRRDQAARYFRGAIKAVPEFGEAWRHLVVCKTYAACDDDDIQTLEALRAKKDLPRSVLVDILFALGKAYDDCGCYDDAFECIRSANNIERDVICFQPERLRERYKDAVKIFRDVPPRRNTPTKENGLPIPVFVVGLPRSGTSLVEQLLSGHSSVFASGERTWFHDLEKRMPELVGSKRPYPYCVRDVDNVLLQRLAVEYQTHLQRISDGSRYVVDKLPANFERLGLIAMLFPESPIVHCVRNPLDACLSMYFLRFPGAIHYSYDLGHLAEYCCFHGRMMSLWRELYGDRIIEVKYEELVEQPVSGLRRLFDFIGLPLEEACISKKERRWVRTASDHQAHGDIYQTSRGRWQHYKAHLSELKAAVEGCTSCSGEDY